MTLSFVVVINLLFLAHLSRRQFVRRLLTFSFKDFFSQTTWPISTKLGGKHDWGMGIQICSNKGAGPFWGPIRGEIRENKFKY